MKRENIFKLLQTNYNPRKEILKIRKILKYDYLFCKCKMIDKDEKPAINYTFQSFFDKYLFNDYKYKGTCLSVEEFYEYSNADFTEYTGVISNDMIINFLEVTENLFKLYFDNSELLQINEQIKYYGDTYRQIMFLIDTLEKKLGIKKKVYKDKIILYLGSYKLESALEIVEEQDLAVELIKYDRENLSYKEKRKILKQLDILVQPITDKIIKNHQEDKDIQYNIAKDLNYIFNNFELRHSNLNSKSKDFKPNLKMFKEKDFDEVYDTVYELILDVLIFSKYNENLKRKVKDFKTKLQNI